MQRASSLALLGAATVAALGIGDAQALVAVSIQSYETVSADDIVGNNIDDFIAVPLDGIAADEVTLFQFDPSWGTVNAVRIEISPRFDLVAAAIFTDDAGGSASGSVQIQGTVSVALPGFSQDGSSADDASCTSAVTESTCTATIIDLDLFGAPLSQTLTGAAMLPYIGTGTVTASVTQFGEATFDETDGDASDFIEFYGAFLKAEGTVRIVYDYTAFDVAEPAGLGLIGLGLAAVGAARRRKLPN